MRPRKYGEKVFDFMGAGLEYKRIIVRYDSKRHKYVFQAWNGTRSKEWELSKKTGEAVLNVLGQIQAAHDRARRDRLLITVQELGWRW